MTSADSIIQRARDYGNPVIQGNRATFIWEGDTAPRLISDLTHWDERAKSFKRLTSTPSSPLTTSLKPATNSTVWSCSLTVPRDAYIEYAFYDPATQDRFLDPLNSQTVSNGMGSRNNFFYMPETMPSPFSMRHADVRVGALTRHRVDSGFLQDDGERDIYLYKPPAKGPFPLLVVYDGPDYLNRGRLTTIVDNLIADKRIRPVAMAILQNGRSRRNLEYLCSDATITWLDREILPLAREHLKLIDIEENPGAYGVLGASAGGLMSVYTGLRMPEIFGRVLCQSGVFAWEGRDFAAVDLVRHEHARDINIWMDVGQLDDLLQDNRRMIRLLNEKNYNVTYREFSGAHNYTSWRDDLWRGLEEMFPYTSR
jgi:enterochelin esterase-like enzyme